MADRAEPATACVIGGGPAGLMAAERTAAAGLHVVLCDAKPSLGRKFLMAGKSGLNLTRDEPFDAFLPRYGAAAGRLSPMVRAFDAAAVVHWAQELGQPVFTGSTGRVFPVAMKASPLLRAWLARLDALGVERRTGWRWDGWQGAALAFETPQGRRSLRPDATVLALGGASWARLGSDGHWTRFLAARGVGLAPFRPSNVGVAVPWSRHMSGVIGKPLKSVAFEAGALRSRGEAVVSARGLEGGGVYTLGPALRDGAPLRLDLLPDLSAAQIADRLRRPRAKASLSNHLRKTLNMGPVARALLNELARDLPDDPAGMAARIKSLTVPYTGLHPMDEAISTAGGVSFAALDDGLMLRDVPGVWCAGEMLDWDAPTGGYLLTACLASGRWAGEAVARRFTPDP
ncbi:MAG: TIGR03862 family flavoprotein [Rhodobacteraceae bacterium]|nr:TIGR03862 family flavoprotein [Paracoccaceae bacterium]